MNKIVLVDKIEGVSSFDSIKKVKKIFDTNKVGHCGTLDPFASGLLIIGVNQATKILPFIFAESKEYIATISFGNDTSTLDTEGEVTNTKEITKVSKEEVINVISTFVGKIKQTPPIYSAIHVDGKKLYEYARNNEKVEIPEREVFIDYIDLLDLKDDCITIKVKCSKGTYIRTLGVDIAHKLNNAGHLTYLRRISIGNINVDKANNYDDIKKGIINSYDITDIVDLPVIDIKDKRRLIKVYNGQEINIESNENTVLVKDENEIVAVYNKKEDNIYCCSRGLFDEDIRLSRLRILKG